jgi:hypothetical protein
MGSAQRGQSTEQEDYRRLGDKEKFNRANAVGDHRRSGDQEIRRDYSR